MNTKVVWKEAMLFDGVIESSKGELRVGMDAKSPIGKDSAPTPKELVAMGLAGCTAMDVIALLKKYKQMPTSFEVETAITTSEKKQPAVFDAAMLTYHVTGEVDRLKLIEAVTLSQTKYCGVSSMLSKAFPINYQIKLNDEVVAEGSASF